jgi:benzoyl-CoA 2,3-epoxidase subunit A
MNALNPDATATSGVLEQHLIDPEICIRCNTCEATCPIGAITHDDTNYVVDADKCNACMACISPCPTGSIDNWRTVLRAKAYTLEEQLGWDELPEQVEINAQALAASTAAADGAGVEIADTAASASDDNDGNDGNTTHAERTPDHAPQAMPMSATVPPWSGAHAYTQLYGPKAASPFVSAKVVGNHRVTDAARDGNEDNDTHHIVLDFGDMPFPVLEGQSIGIIPPGTDAKGKPHQPRQYSIASARNGERPGYNNASITVKRVLIDHSGAPTRGVASNYVCDLKVGDTVQVVGPFGASFLMPNHAGSHIVMICTGTGSAPMRAMTEWRRREAKAGQFTDSQLLLFFGARSQAELPYFGPLQTLPSSLITTHLALSREPGQPKRYVQDAMRDEAQALAALLTNPNAYFYVCGLKAMEAGVLQALQDICQQHNIDWASTAAHMKATGRLHLETY